MSEPKTVLQWTETNGIDYRIRVGERPGSAHWNLLKEAKLPDTPGWSRISGIETRSKPEVLPDD